MINPETSTNVATKGDEAVAGSKPIFLSINGTKDPDKVPQSTIAIKDKATVNPINIQYSP